MTRLRLLRAFEVTFTRTLEEEDIPVRGNCSASGDDAADKEAEEDILAQLRRGNGAAWCCAKVVARWGAFSGTAYLGCCSYETEASLWADLADTMQEEALESLNAVLMADYEALSSRLTGSDK